MTVYAVHAYVNVSDNILLSWAETILGAMPPEPD